MGNFTYILCENYALLEILLGSIISWILMSGLHDGVHGHKYPYCVASCINLHLPWKFMWGTILSRDIFISLFIKEVVESVDVNMYTVLPHYIQFYHIFCHNFSRKCDEHWGKNYNYALVKILSREIFAWLFIKASHGGVHRHEYPYHVATLHSTIIAFFLKTMHQ
jgi:hypothetical protein